MAVGAAVGPLLRERAHARTRDGFRWLISGLMMKNTGARPGGCEVFEGGVGGGGRVRRGSGLKGDVGGGEEVCEEGCGEEVRGEEG